MRQNKSALLQTQLDSVRISTDRPAFLQTQVNSVCIPTDRPALPYFYRHGLRTPLSSRRISTSEPCKVGFKKPVSQQTTAKRPKPLKQRSHGPIAFQQTESYNHFLIFQPAEYIFFLN